MSPPTAALPAWARPLPSAPSVPPSDSGLRGTGAAAKPPGAEPPSGIGRLLGLAKFAGIDPVAFAEHAWRSSTLPQIDRFTRRAAEIDPEKALQVAGLLAWAVGGRKPELPSLTPKGLSWVFLASKDELRQMAVEIARLDPSAARALWVCLQEALEASGGLPETDCASA
jgi:hypothetical protein